MNPPDVARAIEALRRSITPAQARAVILFGSAARDQAGPESDIDLLILPRDRRGEARILQAIREVEESFRVRCSPIVSRSRKLSDLDRQLLESICRHGVALVGCLPALDLRDLDLEPVRLLTLSMAGLAQAEKVHLERELFGYQTERRHRKRTYQSRSLGLIRQAGGRRIGRSIVIVPEKAVPEVEAVLERHHAQRMLTPVWIQRP